VEGAEMLVIPQYATGASAGVKNGSVALPVFHSFAEETHFVDVANTKNGSFNFTASASGSWIKLSAKEGNVTAQADARIEVSLDWKSIPEDGKGSIIISGNGVNVTVEVTVDIFDPKIILPSKTYIETDGYISILSTNFAKSVEGVDGAKWEVLPFYGRERSSVKVCPSVIDGHLTPGKDAPYLEYNVYIRTPGDIDIVTQWAPTSGWDPSYLTRLRYGVSLNNDTIQIVHTLPIDYYVTGGDKVEWGAGVETAVRTVRSNEGDICYSKHKVTEAGLYTLRIYMVDDGLVLQKILVGTNTLERMNTTGHSANVFCDPETRERTTEKKAVTIPAVSLPRMFVGMRVMTTGSYWTYFGPEETTYTE
jgi:hypothetical protein